MAYTLSFFHRQGNLGFGMWQVGSVVYLLGDSTLRPGESQCTRTKDVLLGVIKRGAGFAHCTRKNFVLSWYWNGPQPPPPPSFLAYPTLSDYNKAGKDYETGS